MSGILTIDQSHAENRGSIPGRDRPNSLKHVVTAPLPNAWQQVQVTQVLGDDHYKGLARADPSLLNGNECRSKVKICSTSLAMVKSPNG